MRSRSIAVLLAITVFSACGDDDSSGGITDPTYARFREQATACGAETPATAQEMSFAMPEELGINGEVSATLHTSCGDVVIELLPEVAPATVNSFVFLAEQGYFDGTVSHRIAPGFVVQFGDPTGSGRGGPGYRIVDELPGSDFEYTTGIVAMANGGPNSGGSQFFIVFDDISLDPDYTVFGFVSSGLDVLVRIASVPVGTNPNTFEPSLPLQTLYIDSVTIQR